jgi:GAF domain-containing protein
MPEEIGEQPPRRADALAELQATLERAGELLHSLENSPGGKPPSVHSLNSNHANLAELQDRLKDVVQDRDELSQRLAEYEQQTGRLMNLYVATYQLHATLDPGEVQSTIAEIAINLLGAERFALLFWKGDGGECEIAMGQGLEEESSGLYQGGKYSGGDPAVDATLTDGVLRMGPIDGSDAVAVVPLTVQGAVVGALVLLKLFEHKAMLRSEDRELLDLLAAHAASALFAARVYSATDRKLKTLESLIQLVKRG